MFYVPDRYETERHVDRMAQLGHPIQIDIPFDIDLGELVPGHTVVARGIEFGTSEGVLHDEFVPGITSEE